MVKLLVYRCSYFFYRQVVEFMRCVIEFETDVVGM